MNGLAVATALDGVSGTCQIPDDSGSDQCHWFVSIPPERIGLHGEFDYHGLSKRVSHCLNAQADDALGRLKVRQRGRVVVLSGQLGCAHQLSKVVNLALSIDGVDEVETRGIALIEA
ncbi:phospholipid-binding protein [Leptolyngbya sp. Heron Island J]|uniref:phospholipid-binding protein n=1 Tax=Leptolyngbya sp. Heron Island J TaxID=1385935 RepID=UPI0003B9427E|nr:phospholipid-binding protein [Leptolyngbya sp. Heron Island J]ESA33093.1 phospholipid-binding protein [Leptolyngbya sp. Heron Island J]